MANISERRDKDGNIISYQIRVFRGRDAAGKRLKDYQMTWKPTPGMTPRQVKRELERQATLFEEACRNGQVSIEKPTFEKYANYVIDLKARTGAKQKTLSSYKDLLKRIIPELGPIKLTDLRAEHLNRLYKKLSEPGQRLNSEKAVASTNILAWLKRNSLSQTAFSKQAHISQASLASAASGNPVSVKTAERISEAMGGSLKQYFKTVKSDDRLSDKSILEHHRLISAILEQAVKEGILIYNVAKRATPPKVQRREIQALELENIAAIFEALKTEPLKWQVCVQLMIATGARRGEVMGLRWSCIDWKGNKLHLSENRVYTSESGSISTTLKTGESRIVTVPVSVMTLLRSWRLEQMEHFSALNIPAPLYVMTAEDGGPMHPDSPTDWLDKFSKRHGLPHLHPHLFRHSQASLLIAQGVDVLTISKRLGHSRTSTTLDIYSHLLAKSDAEASDKIDELLYQKQA